uniref:Uncharacterized protein n=1 Tax=Lotus japonicus TaxID=34305 RepID=I3T6F2_LOTJA|nr:unknown [Lotus japonicus]
MPISRSNNNSSASNLVKIPSTARSYSPTSFWFNFNNVHVLQLLQNVSGNSTTALAEMWRTASIPLASTIDPPESTNAKTSPQIDLSCHGSSSNIIPVRIIGSQFLKFCCFYNIRPLRKLHLARALEMRGVSLYELVRRHILHGLRGCHG